ncbi:MAG: hypothetical protein ACLFT3_17810, partial [Cyclobacteriaceae bacterium]
HHYGFTKENVLVLRNGKTLESNKYTFYNALNSLSEVRGVSFTDISPLAGRVRRLRIYSGNLRR